MTQKLKQKISEVKEGCGKEVCNIFESDDNNSVYDVCGKSEFIDKHERLIFLCSTCQAKLSALQEAQDIFIGMIDDMLNKNKQEIIELEKKGKFKHYPKDYFPPFINGKELKEGVK